jgi:hypothetical protein
MSQEPGSFEQNADGISADVSVVDDRFATEPMTAMQPAEQQVSEEELHRFFEQAISDRVQAVRVRLDRISEPLTCQSSTIADVRYTGTFAGVPSTEPLKLSGAVGMWSSLLSNPWQRGITLMSLALLLLMSGFDLMGLLFLHMR